MEKEGDSRVFNQKIAKNTNLRIVQCVTETTGTKNKTVNSRVWIVVEVFFALD
jgi:hypothetical protein